MLGWAQVSRWRSNELEALSRELKTVRVAVSRTLDSFEDHTRLEGWNGAAAEAASRARSQAARMAYERIGDLAYVSRALGEAADDVQGLERGVRLIVDTARSRHLTIATDGTVTDALPAPTTIASAQAGESYVAQRQAAIDDVVLRIEQLLQQAARVDANLTSSLSAIASGLVTTGGAFAEADAVTQAENLVRTSPLTPPANADAATARAWLDTLSSHDRAAVLAKHPRLREPDGLGDCEVFSEERGLDAEAVIVSIAIGGEATVTLTQLIDETGAEKWQVKRLSEPRAGVAFGEGTEAHWGALREGEEITAQALATAEVVDVYSFATEKQARDYFDAAQRSTLFAAALPPGVRQHADLFAGAHPPEGGASERSGQLGVREAFGLDATKRGSGGQGDVFGIGAAGGKTNGPERTEYLRLRGEAAGSAAFAAGILTAQAGRTVEGDALVGVTYRNGAPVKASVELSAQDVMGGGGEINVADRPGGYVPRHAAAAPDRLLDALGGKTQSGSADAVKVEFDLANPGNADALRRTVRGVTGGDPEGARALLDRYASASRSDGVTATHLHYDVTTTSVDAGMSGSALVKGGAALGPAIERKTVNGAYYRDPATHRWLPWARCRTVPGSATPLETR